MDWTTISDDDPKLTDTRWFVLTKPVLDFTQLEAAAGPMNGSACALLEDPEVTGDGAATVRLTGEAAMDAEEFEAVTKGAHHGRHRVVHHRVDHHILRPSQACG
jgi:hypothetical protein